MGGYAIRDKRGIEEVVRILKELKLILDTPWGYDPYLLIGHEKGRKLPNPQDHESRLDIEKLTNKETFEEVERITRGEADTSKIIVQYFLDPTHEPLDAPPYFIFYRRKWIVVTKEDIEFQAPTS